MLTTTSLTWLAAGSEIDEATMWAEMNEAMPLSLLAPEYVVPYEDDDGFAAAITGLVR